MDPQNSRLTSGTYHVIIRGFKNRELVFEQTYNTEETDLEALAFEHAAKVGESLHMIEVEFLDEPDVNQRFLRFGSDPSMMVMPTRIV